MEGLASLLPKVYPSSEPEQARAQRIFAAWGRIVPPRVLKNARPVSFRNGILMVHTATSAWANVLSFETDEILAKLKARVPGSKVRLLRLRTGPLPRDWDPPPPKSVRPPLRPLAVLPEDVAGELARRGDDDQRDTIARAAALSLSGEKRRAE
jgi:hypothetical protein